MNLSMTNEEPKSKKDPLEPERARMRVAVAEITFAWADLENASVLILRTMMGDSGYLASPIYFAANNLETRLRIIDAAFRRFLEGHSRETEILEIWGQLQNAVNRQKDVRNKIAHGEMITHIRGDGRRYIRLTASLLDHERFRESRRRKQLPGMSAHDIEKSTATIDALKERLQIVFRLSRALMSENEEALSGILAQLRADLPT